MAEYSYQEQLWHIITQISSRSQNKSRRTNQPRNHKMIGNIPKPPCSLWDFINNFRNKTEKQMNSNFSSSRIHKKAEKIQRPENVYRKLHQNLEGLKKKKLLDLTKIKQFASSFYDTIQIDSSLLQEITNFLQTEKQIKLKLDQHNQQLAQQSEKCIRIFTRIKQQEDMQKFIAGQLPEFKEKINDFLNFVEKQLDNLLHFLNLQDSPPLLFLNQEDYKECIQNLPQLKEVLTKIEELITKQYTKLYQMIETDDKSTTAFHFLANMSQVFNDISKFTLAEDSLMNRLIYLAYLKKTKLIRMFSNIYSSYICAKIQCKGICTKQDIALQSLQPENSKTPTQFNHRGISTQFHIQIYKFYLLRPDNNFIEESLAKIKVGMGEILDRLLKTIADYTIEKSSALGKIQKITKQLKAYYPKLEYLMLLLSSSKIRLLVMILHEREYETMVEIQKIKYQLEEMLNFNIDVSFIFWNTYSNIHKNNQQVKGHLQQFSKKKWNGNEHRILVKYQLVISESQNHIQQLENILKNRKKSANIFRNHIAAINSLNLLANKSKQTKALQQKLLSIQFDYFQFNSKSQHPNQPSNRPHLNNVSDEFESRIISDESFAQQPQDFVLGNRNTNFIQSSQVSQINITNSHGSSLDNSEQIDIPLTTRNQPKIVINNIQSTNFEVSEINHERISLILSEASIFFQEKLQKLLLNGYELFYYQSGHQPQNPRGSGKKKDHETTDYRISQQLGDKVEYWRRNDKALKILQKFRDQIYHSVPSIRSKTPINPKSSIQISQVEKPSRNIYTQSIIRIEAESDEEEHLQVSKIKTQINLQSKRNVTSKFESQSFLNLSNNKNNLYEDESHQLKLTFLNLQILQMLIQDQHQNISPQENQKKNKQIRIDKKVTFIPLKTPIKTIIETYLNLQYQNWKENTGLVSGYITNNLQSKLKSLKTILQSNARIIFSDCYKIYRDSINLIEIYIDILTELLQIYRTIKQSQSVRRKSNYYIMISSDDYQYYKMISEFIIQMWQQIQQLKQFTQIPLKIRNYLIEVYEIFYRNFIRHVGYETSSEGLGYLVSKLSNALIFKDNHDKIFEAFYQTIQADIEIIKNNLKNEKQPYKKLSEQKKRAVNSVLQEMKNISKQILSVKKQNQQFLVIDRKFEQQWGISIQIQGLVWFQEIDLSYKDYYRLAENILQQLGSGQGKKSQKYQNKIIDIKVKNIQMKVKDIFGLLGKI